MTDIWCLKAPVDLIPRFVLFTSRLDSNPEHKTFHQNPSFTFKYGVIYLPHFNHLSIDRVIFIDRFSLINIEMQLYFLSLYIYLYFCVYWLGRALSSNIRYEVWRTCSMCIDFRWLAARVHSYESLFTRFFSPLCIRCRRSSLSPNDWDFPVRNDLKAR